MIEIIIGFLIFELIYIADYRMSEKTDKN